MDISATSPVSYAINAKKHLGKSPEARMGLHTGWSRLDQRIRGLHNGKLYVVAGRPGDGKTSFGTSLTANVMLQRDFPVLYVSTELEEDEIMLQVVEAYCQGTPVYPNRRASTPEEMERLTAGLDELSTQERYNLLNVVHQKRVTVEEMTEWVNQIKPDDDRSFLVIVDQASRVQRDDAGGKRQYTIATEDMLNGLEAMAHETQSAVVLLTQLNRQTEMQGQPMMSNIKHSGAFEEFAHTVLLLERLEGNGQKIEGSGFVHYDARIHVAKNRYGSLGPIDFSFQGECHHWWEQPERKAIPR